MSERIIRGYAERMAGYRRVLEARSTTTSAGRLRELAADEIRPVRVWTARNHNTPADALDPLTRDSDRIVRWIALLHPRTPAHALERIARDHQDPFDIHSSTVRDRIAHHPHTPDGLRQALAQAGACPNCSPTCPEARTYTHRHPWQSRYEPADRFRRTDAERADQLLSWQRDDQAFFAAGACHILAWAFLQTNPDSGYEIHGLRRPGEAHCHHVYVTDGLWAFDHCGWTLASELRKAYQSENLIIRSDLETFCAEHNSRLPHQFAHLPWQRAHNYIARYT
ncbi:hypothetical protein AB0M79_25310 [Polymorphospora sp. NPDC051019]|uniref:hypothetical protein n=1 Tax=Polymorphospora sp. NPDC051019 TaxID=3155725 RepID=UPI003427AC91